jgi:hypothetical protein
MYMVKTKSQHGINLHKVDTQVQSHLQVVSILCIIFNFLTRKIP